MLLKLVFLMMIWHRGAASDDLLDVLAGVHGGNRVTLCLGDSEQDGIPSRCPGVLLREHWVLTRASCLHFQSLYKVLVPMVQWVDCDDFIIGNNLQQASKVRVKFVHPEYQQSACGDLALVALERSHQRLDPLVNMTSAHNLLTEYTQWMEEVYNNYPMGPRRVSYAHKSCLFSTPLRMFITSIIVPTVSFIVFFLLVIFFTGTGPKDQIPYKSIEYEDSLLGV